MENRKQTQTINLPALLYLQMLCFFVLFLYDYAAPGLVQGACCVVVFTNPLLLILCGELYLREKFWHRTLIPFVWEMGLAILSVGAMLCGIFRMESGSGLFVRFLVLYLADAAVCALFRLKNR